MAKRSARHGQNFLCDHNIARRIVDTLPEGIVSLLEVGPGPGILTEFVLQKGIKASQIWAVELEAILAEGLRKKWPSIHVVTADILKVNPELLGLPLPLYLISNLAYDISKPFFDWLIDWHDLLTGATIMVQKEFATKIILQERSSAQGVMLAHLFVIKRCFQVHPGAFRPAPKVDSTVLTLTPRCQEMSRQDIRKYYGFLKQCFAAPRKTLHNNIKAAWPQEVNDQLSGCGIAQTVRPGELGPEDFALLWRAIRPHHSTESSTVKIN